MVDGGVENCDPLAAPRGFPDLSVNLKSLPPGHPTETMGIASFGSFLDLQVRGLELLEPVIIRSSVGSRYSKN